MQTRRIALFAFLLLNFSACQGHPPPRVARPNQIIYQTDPLARLLDGDYSGGRTTLGELEQLGNFGLGTFSGYQGGEMMIFQGVVRSIPHPSGSVIVKDPSIRIPFAVATRFQPRKSIKLKDVADYAELRARLETLLDPSKNYAILVEGNFRDLRVQCVQPPGKPGLAFAEVAQEPAQLKDVRAKFVGFKTVDGNTGHNRGGYHFHALTSRGEGGHLLDFRNLESVQVRLQEASSLQILHP